MARPYNVSTSLRQIANGPPEGDFDIFYRPTVEVEAETLSRLADIIDRRESDVRAVARELRLLAANPGEWMRNYGPDLPTLADMLDGRSST